MARPTVDEEITRLEAELAAIRSVIGKQQGFRSLEEGSQSSRFKTEFASISDLRKQESEINTRLNTLYSYAAVRF